MELLCHEKMIDYVDFELARVGQVRSPFQIETASGRIFDVPHRDFISFSRKKTAVIISYEKDGEDHIAIVPLLTVTSTMAKAA